MASGQSPVIESPESRSEGSQGPTHTSCPEKVVETKHQITTEITTVPWYQPDPSYEGRSWESEITRDPSSEQQEEEVTVCHFYLAGKCHFGPRCRFSHSFTAKDDPKPGVSEQDGGKEEEEEKLEKHKKGSAKANKALKPKHTKGNEVEQRTKKPRMRTADDVISRILWDAEAEAAHFVVGYVDRFLGVLERPFSEFNWDTDPCDCDYSSELALPRHRIQYFAFRGHRVWDRNSRTDRVFGSTGQSLAPPFGEEGEAGGIRTQDAEQTDLNNGEALERTEDGQGVERVTVESSTESTHLEEITNTLSTQTALDDTSQEQPENEEMEAVVNDAIHRAGGVEEETAKGESLEEWNDSWENHKEQNPSEEPDVVSPCPVSPEEQKKQCGSGRPAKRRPTHFITFRANTPGILSGFQRLQEEVCALLPSSAPHWISSSTLHVTMCLLLLHGPEEVAAAGEILRRFAYLDRNPPVAVTFPLKLKHFNGKVLYLSPQPQLHLQQLNSGMQEAFREAGLLHRNSFNPRYHLTLAKVEGREGERVFERVGELRVGKGLNLGRLPVNTLHLCSMGIEDTDGFYDIVCTVTLR